MDDLNELLGSDSEDEIELTKEIENGKEELEKDLSAVDYHDAKKDDDKKDDNIDSKPENIGMDELEQILGKSTIPSTISNKKVKQTSKLHVNEVERIPENARRLFVRTPHFLKINSSEYDPETYDPENEEEKELSVRWRIRKGPTGEPIAGKDGKPQLESNARLIKWDDGTYQLVIGRAVFNSKIMSTENLYTFQEHKNPDTLGEDDDNTANGVSNSGGNCLECVGAVDSRMILQPLSINSSTHAKVSLKIHQKFKKENKIIKQDNDNNMMHPDKIIAQVCKQEEEEIKSFKKQQLKAMEYRQSSGFGGIDPRGASSSSRGGFSAEKSRPAMSSTYLDDNDMFDGEIGGAYARRAAVPAKKKKAPSKRRGGDEEDDDDAEDLGSKDSEDEEEDDDDQENDSIVVDDDEEEEEEDDGNDDDDEEGDDESNEDNDDDGEATHKKKEKKLGKKEKDDSRSDKKKKNKKKDKDKKKKKNKNKKDKNKEKEGGGRKLVTKTKRNTDLEAANDSMTAAVDNGDGEDDEENLNLRYNKRLKRTVIESDDDEDA